MKRLLAPAVTVVAVVVVFVVAAGVLVAASDAAKPAPTASVSWAQVAVDDPTAQTGVHLVRGRDAVSATGDNLADGAFIVTFNKDVSQCAFTATNGNQNDPDDALTIGASPGTDPNSVFLIMYDTVLARDNRSDGLYLVVNC